MQEKKETNKPTKGIKEYFPANTAPQIRKLTHYKKKDRMQGASLSPSMHTVFCLNFTLIFCKSICACTFFYPL